MTSSVCLNQFIALTIFMQHIKLLFSAYTFFLIVIVRIRVLYLIIIVIKSEVQISGHCLGLGY